MKRIIFYLLASSFLSQLMAAQKRNIDTVYLPKNEKIVDLSNIYNLTKKKKDSLNTEIKEFDCKYISDFNLNELFAKNIPLFKLSKKYDVSKNILNYLTPSKDNNRYIITNKNKYLTVISNYTFINNDPVFFDCTIAQYLGNNIQYILKNYYQNDLYFFQIQGINNVQFVIEEGNAYALYTNKLGDFEKIEINAFFQKNIVNSIYYESKRRRNLILKEKNLQFRDDYFIQLKE